MASGIPAYEGRARFRLHGDIRDCTEILADVAVLAGRPYLPYTAATALAGTPLGTAGFGPSRGVSGVTPLPFAAAVALLAAIAVAVALVAARTTIRRDVS